MPTLPPDLVARRPGRFRSRSSLASAAALAAVAAPSLLQAQIVWSGLLNTNVDTNTTQALLDLNLNSNADLTEAYLTFTNFKGSYYVGVSGIASYKTDPTDAFLYADTPVAYGGTIDSSLNYVGAHPGDLVPSDGNNYYYAFSYQATGGPYYGWMELSHSADGLTGTLVQWAYNSVAGASLTSGQVSAVPEPATAAAILGLAAVGTVWWRKRRRPHHQP